MKRIIVFISLLLLLSISVSAHGGRTDSSGGHIDSSTGEYHYHHGFPAHQHYDMDGDGDVDCPYEFVDKTEETSGSSSIDSSLDSTIESGDTTLSTGVPGSSDSVVFDKRSQNNTEFTVHEKKSSIVFFILFSCLILSCIYSYRSSFFRFFSRFFPNISSRMKYRNAYPLYCSCCKIFSIYCSAIPVIQYDLQKNIYEYRNFKKSTFKYDLDRKSYIVVFNTLFHCLCSGFYGISSGELTETGRYLYSAFLRISYDMKNLGYISSRTRFSKIYVVCEKILRSDGIHPLPSDEDLAYSYGISVDSLRFLNSRRVETKIPVDMIQYAKTSVSPSDEQDYYLVQSIDGGYYWFPIDRYVKWRSSSLYKDFLKTDQEPLPLLT